MPDTTLSPNMNLIIPTVSLDPGPDWANNINSSLSILDQHTHAPGSGVPITQDAISLTAALPSYDSLSFNSSNAYNLRSVRFVSQAAALALGTDLRCLYSVSADLYYNDGAGNQVRITQGGSVTGSSGTITGLPSGTASAAYSSGTFTFQSATNTAANIDGGSYVFRNATASSFGLTLSPPNAMGANYALTLPSLPGATSIMRLDTSGTMSASLVVDNSTIVISSNTLQVPNGGITRPKMVAVGQQISSSCGLYVVSTNTPAAVTNLSVTLTTTGRPVMVLIQSDAVASNNGCNVEVDGGVGGAAKTTLTYMRDSTDIGYYEYISSASTATRWPGMSFVLDTPAAGTYTYSIEAVVIGSGSFSSTINFAVLVAYEL